MKPYVSDSKPPRSENNVPELLTCDLSALTPEDSRHWVANAVVQCVAETDAGPKIDREKLNDFVERHYSRLVRGNQLDFGPILGALCRIKGVSEANLYIGLVNLQQRLAGLNIEMGMPDLSLDQYTRAQLLREAHESTERARLEGEQSRLRGAVQDLNRAKLGALLVRERLIDEDELTQALALQQSTGGRLGSNLVRLGLISEGDLARFLGRQLGLPCVTEITHIPAAARRAIPEELLIKCRVVPLAVDDREIQVAMVDPTDLVSIDEIGFVTNRRVRPVVAPELVVDFARARFFGIRRPPRLLAAQQAPDDGPPSFPRSVLERGPAVLPAPDDEPYDLPELVHDLLSCEVVDDLLPPLWRLWQEHFRVVGQLGVTEDMVRGRRLVGVAGQAEGFGQVEAPVGSHPVIDRVVRDKAPYRGPIANDGGRWLSDPLGVNPSEPVWILPILDDADQVATLMIGCGNRTEPPDEDWLAAAQTAVRNAVTMVQARRALRRVQAAGRPTVHRMQNVV